MLTDSKIPTTPSCLHSWKHIPKAERDTEAQTAVISTALGTTLETGLVQGEVLLSHRFKMPSLISTVLKKEHSPVIRGIVWIQSTTDPYMLLHLLFHPQELAEQTMGCCQLQSEDSFLSLPSFGGPLKTGKTKTHTA